MKAVKFWLIIITSMFINTYSVQAAKTINDGTYTIHSVLDQNKLIDVSGAKTDNGTNIQIWENNGHNAQKWIVKYTSGYYQIKSKLDENKCLEVKEETITNGTNIELNDCNNSNNQQFIIKLNNGYFNIASKIKTNMFIDVSQAKTTNGTNIQLWEDNGHNAQKWNFIEDLNTEEIIESGNYILSTTLDDSKNLDVSEAKTTNGTNIQIWENNGHNAQKWTVKYLNNGYYNIISKLKYNKCLTVKNSNYSIYSNIELSDCNNKDNQQFIIKKIDNNYSIITKINHLYLTVKNSKTTNGTNVELYYNTGNNNQKWILKETITTKKTINDGTYTIHSVLDQNKSINITDTNINLWDSNNENNQKWIIKYLNNGYYQIKSKLDENKCLSIKDNEYINNTNIELNECNDKDNQQFSIKDLNNGYFTITAKYNNVNIDVSQAKTTNGTNIQLWEDNGHNAQKWNFIEDLNTEEIIESGNYILSTTLDDSKNLDVSGAKTTNGTNIQIWENNGNKAQMWKLEYKNGYYQLKSKLNTKKCLIVKNSNYSIYSNIELSDCNNKDNQQFIIKKIDNDHYSIITKINHLYLTVKNSKTTNGTNVELYYNTGNDNQKWILNNLDKNDIETGTYIINTSLNKNQNIDVDGAKSFINTNIQLWENNDNNAQKWYVQKQKDKSYLIRSALNSSLFLSYKNNNVILDEKETYWEIEYIEKNKYSIKLKDENLYINVDNVDATNSTNINLVNNNKNNSQLFEFNETEYNETSNSISTSYYIIETKLKNSQNIDVDGAKRINGTNIQLWENNGNKAQIWKINYINNGTFQILSSMNTNLSINIEDNRTVPKTNINLWKKNNINTQKWKFIDDKNGYVSIKSIANNICITVSDNNANNSTNIYVDTCNNGDNQKFKLKRYTDKKIYKGIDVSQYQGNIDWETTSKKIDFVIIRAGYGDNWTSQDDKKFIRNVEECEKYNIPYGVYIYSYAKRVQKDNNDANLNYDAESAVSEAAHIIRLLNSVNYKPNLKTSVYLDMEEDSLGISLGKETLTNITNKFCSIIKSNGYGCGVYANRNWLKNYLDINNIIKNYNLWLAEWISSNSYSTAQNTETNYQTTNYTLWQFSESGTINGITGDVDLDLGFNIFD